jgi:hypothetical protein
MRSLRIVTADFAALGEIGGYTSLRLTRRHYGVGEFELHLAMAAAFAGELAIDRMLIPAGAPHKAMLIESLVRQEAKGEITVKGCTLDGLAKRRLAVPPPSAGNTFGWDRVSGDAETVIKHFAANNLSAPPETKRAMPNLVIAPNLHRGRDMPGQARFEQLDALLQGLAEYADMGWGIAPDFAGNRLVFDVTPGRDLAVGNASGAHVILSLAMGNLSEITHTLDAASLRNTAYVGGQGEDELRLILAVGGREVSGNNTPDDHCAGLARRETWIDGGSLELPAELVTAARRKLADTETKHTMQGAVLRHGAFQYERDFDLGDRVTLQASAGRLDARVIEARETYERDKPPGIELVFGEAPATLAAAIKEINNQIVR